MQKSTMTVPPSPPPPPPPTSPSPGPKINRKTMIVLGVIVIIVVAIVAGVLLAMQSGGGVGGTGGSIAGASSLKFNADVTVSGTSATYTYYAKNIGTSNAMLRVEGTAPTSFIYIINGAQKQAWAYESGVWTNLTDYFQTYWGQWNSSFTGMKTNLGHWSGSGAYTYTDPTTGYSIKIYNIAVNPSLADSLFEH
jgi:hypothetical protein